MAVLIRLGLDLALKSSNSGGAQDEIKDKTAIAYIRFICVSLNVSLWPPINQAFAHLLTIFPSSFNSSFNVPALYLFLLSQRERLVSTFLIRRSFLRPSQIT